MNLKTIKEIAVAWLEYKRPFVKDSTFAAYALTVQNHIVPAFGESCELPETDVQQFVLQKLENGISVKTIKDILIVLKMVMKYGVKQSWLLHAEWDIKYPTTSTNKELEVLSVGNHRKILNHIQSHFTFTGLGIYISLSTGLRIGEICALKFQSLGIYLCLTTGLRIGEICALRWSDICLKKGSLTVQRTIERIYVITPDEKHTEIVINTPKTANSCREIPLSREALSLIKPLLKVVNPAFYVVTNDAKPTEPRTYRSFYKRFMASLNMPDLKFHGLRHSFATRCIESGCDYKTVSVLLGHANISTTLDLYVHPNMEQKKRCIERMVKSVK